ncbi:manganese-dependent inorganic pyrophosphatase, partial [Pseudoalteromonas sp. SIMBA_148]
MTMYVVSHKIPDSDTICGSIALAYLNNPIYKPAMPTLLREVSPETKVILEG